MINILICFGVVLILTDGSSVKVYPGGNTTLPCSTEDDREITWIITNGNQTFVRILKLEYVEGNQSKPEPIHIHPSYAGRIKALSSSTNTHSLLLMNITDTDLMLYCCTECMLEQTHCTKLDYEDESPGDVKQQDTENINQLSTCGSSLWLAVVCALILVSLVLNACVCWRRKKHKTGNIKKVNRCEKVEQGNEVDEISYASVNIIKAQKIRGKHQLTQDTVYARIK
ncbi:uncharacterized protein LOC127156140 [Labeo rohita]|uniref:uncharacterized protein LOC127156140 n=1 Tax=Labeo rohita TaxID=84645 RepID=UPI0021E20C62|nr:uncharacterized protein LOC127156140 [Labeo rohita]